MPAMSAEVPRCTKCRRPVAAWKLDHCVYCGTALPPDFRETYPEPEGVRRAEPRELPPEAAKQLELMKVLPSEKPSKSRTILFAMGLLTIPVFALLFYLMYKILSRFASGTSWIVGLAALAFFGYFGWMALRKR